MVEPRRLGVCGGERLAVPVARPVRGAGGHAVLAAVHPGREHPGGLRRVAVERHPEQVGALEDAEVVALEARAVRPGLQVGRRVEAELVPLGEHHEPLAACVVPHDLGVAPVLRARVVHDRVPVERLEAVAAVGRDEERLPLHAVVLLGHDRDDGARAEPGGVRGVDHRAAGLDVAEAVLVFLDRDALLAPVHEVGGGRVIPLGAVPVGVVGVVEVVVVPGAVEPERALRVVHPALGGREVHGRAVGAPLRRACVLRRGRRLVRPHRRIGLRCAAGAERDQDPRDEGGRRRDRGDRPDDRSSPRTRGRTRNGAGRRAASRCSVHDPPSWVAHRRACRIASAMRSVGSAARHRSCLFGEKRKRHSRNRWPR